jgi:hypothetical protein
LFPLPENVGPAEPFMPGAIRYLNLPLRLSQKYQKTTTVGDKITNSSLNVFGDGIISLLYFLWTLSIKCFLNLEKSLDFNLWTRHSSVYKIHQSRCHPFLYLKAKKYPSFKMLRLLRLSNRPCHAWFRQFVTSLSLRKSGFAPEAVHVGFVVDKVALGQVFF